MGYGKKSTCVKSLTLELRTMCQSNRQPTTLKRVKVAGPVEATETSAPVSPHEMMIKQGRNLPVEYWDAF